MAKRIRLYIGLFLLAALLLIGWNMWRRRDGWCVRFYPDGRQEELFGADCRK
jgi:hypothetical protein